MFNLTVQYAYKIHKNLLPKTLINLWVKTTIKYLNCTKEFNLTFRLVDNIEGKILNHSYRNKDYATNVLTFSYDNVICINADIVLSSDVIKDEATKEKKHLISHYAHLVIHGVLHAIGYEHETAKDNQIMQELEIKILSNLGFNNPYFY